VPSSPTGTSICIGTNQRVCHSGLLKKFAG
jgi:hypothetical protein